MTPEQLLEVIKTTIEENEFCFLITVSASGGANARLMQPFAPEPDLTIWFGTSPRSRKIKDIAHDNRVTLAYQDAADPAYVTLLGSAQVETDLNLRRRYWREAWTAFFPAGPDGDDYVLIKFVPSRIELMNFVREIAPEPYGLRPAILVRAGEAWVVATGEEA